jgi:ribonuclease R
MSPRRNRKPPRTSHSHGKSKAKGKGKRPYDDRNESYESRERREERPRGPIPLPAGPSSGPRIGPRPGASPKTHGPGGASNEGRPRPAHAPARGFVFTDRSGKVHGRAGAPVAGPGPRIDSPLSDRPREDRSREDRQRQNRSRDDRQRKPQGGHRPKGQGGFRKLKATVDKNRKGFGFLIFENRSIEDAFVPPRQAENLFHGDRVEVTMDPDGEVSHIAVIAHRFRELVGRFTPHPAGKGSWVVYERKRAREEIFAPKGAKAEPNDWVKAKLHFHESGPYKVTAEITQVYGAELPPSADITMVADEYSLVEEHSDAAEREAQHMRLELNDKARKDLTHVPFITIDGETARDFDDAVYVERARSGYVLWVAIADVSHYVTPNSALDKDARSRGTSVYFPERAFHMLPRALSENLCSLKPNEPRLTLTARMEFDAKGDRVKVEVMESVIHSRRRATYNEIMKEYEQNGRDKGWEYAPHFELYQHLKRKRGERGSIDFDLPEAELNVAPTGEVLSIRKRERNDAHRLIEEFMIVANEAVTDWALERQLPFLYRVHEEPAQQSMLKFQKLAATVGVAIGLSGDNLSLALADVVRRLEGHPAQELLNMSLLRSMPKAVYSAVHGIHFGLASRGYTHFTSPIRRYPDLIVHRMLRHAVRIESGRERAPAKDWKDRMEEELQGIAEHCSYRERLATDAERESIKLKQVRAIIPRLGDEFKGRIIGLVESGMFVEITDPYVEGMVSVDSLTDDYYEFNEERMIMAGKRKKRTFKIGDIVEVRALRADIDRRQIDFGLIGGPIRPDGSGGGPREPERVPRPKDQKGQKDRKQRRGRH